MTRLQLLSLFDRDQHIYQMTFAVLLSVLVSILGSWVLYHSFYHDVLAFFFCFTIAGSQYSLVSYQFSFRMMNEIVQRNIFTILVKKRPARFFVAYTWI